MSGSVHALSDREDFLDVLAEIERELWQRGGVDAHHRRREAMQAAIAAGCSLASVADVLGVSQRDVSAWMPGAYSSEMAL
jgi:hypothetical protein